MKNTKVFKLNYILIYIYRTQRVFTVIGLSRNGSDTAVSLLEPYVAGRSRYRDIHRCSEAFNSIELGPEKARILLLNLEMATPHASGTNGYGQEARNFS